MSCKPYQCSLCDKMQDYDEYCMCSAGIDPRPSKRVKGDKEKCLENFELLAKDKIWHEKFAWEKKND